MSHHSTPDFKQLKRQAKELLKAWRQAEPEALATVEAFHPDPPSGPALHDAQLTLARSLGFRSWNRLKFSVLGRRCLTLAKRGQAKDLSSLLREYPLAVNYAEEERTALHLAVMEGHPGCVRALVEAGADTERGFYPDRARSKPLDLALEREMTEIVELLRGVQPGQEQGEESDPLELACREGRLAQVQALCPTRRLKEDALIWASQAGQREIVAWLLDSGAHVDAAREKFTGWEQEAVKEVGLPLWQAAAGGHLELVELLLGKGAQVNSLIYASGSPIMVASQCGHQAVVKRLFEAGAPLPIDWENDSLQQVQEKLKGQEWLLHEDFALPLACRSGRAELVELLLEYEPRLTRDMWAECCRFCMMVLKEPPASARSGPALMARLLECGADVAYRSKRGETLLHWLCGPWCHLHPANLEFAELLLSRGVPLEECDTEKKATALGWASQNGNLKLVRYLLERGADPSGGGADWARPAALATKRGHQDVVRLLSSTVDRAL